MTINQIREVLMWCSIINIGLLAFMFLMFIAARDFICRIHCKMFSITEQQFNIAMYAFIGGYKLLFFVFNIIPFIAVNIAR